MRQEGSRVRHRILGLLLLASIGCGGASQPATHDADSTAGGAAVGGGGEPIGRPPDLASRREPGLVLLPGKGATLYGEDGAPSRWSIEAAAEASRVLGREIHPDACLERAGEMLLEVAHTTCHDWPPSWLVEPVLHHAGCRDMAARLFFVCTDEDGPEALHRQMRGGIARLEGGEDITHVAVARRRGAEYRWIHAVLLVPRRLDLAVLPRTFSSSSRVALEGRLPGGGQEVTAFAMAPAGSDRWRVAEDGRDAGGVRELPVEHPGSGRFRVELEGLGPPGEHWIELMVRDRSGPHVAALFPVWIDVDPPGFVKPPPPVRVEADTAEEGEVLLYELVNLERGMRGLPLLHYEPMLAPIARAHADAMRREGFFAHVDPRGRGPRARAELEGYRALILGENLARATTITEAHESLMASPAHRANLLDPRHTHVGIGVVEGAAARGERVYWVVELFSLPQPDLRAEEVAELLLDAIDRERARSGRAPLVVSPALGEVARDLAPRAMEHSLERLGAMADARLQQRGVAYRRRLLWRYRLADPTRVPELPDGLDAVDRVGVGVVRSPRDRGPLLEYTVVLLLVR